MRYLKRTRLMPAQTIKNIPDDLYLELKHAAEQHHRSINSEVIVCLKGSLQPHRSSTEVKLADIRALRVQLPPDEFMVDDIAQAIAAGRI